ncbi:MAG: BON domain-containing protein [Methylococcales bacterium]|nr:BON domain-containing protein [Methylococcales bacterium]
MYGIVRILPDFIAKVWLEFKLIASKAFSVMLSSNKNANGYHLAHFLKSNIRNKNDLMKITHKLKKSSAADRALASACLSVILGLAACQQEGTAEKAGQKIDRAAENAQQKIEKATDTAEAKIEAAKDLLDQQTDRAGTYIDKSARASEGAMEKAGKKLDQAAEKSGEKIEGATDSVADKAEKTGEYIDDAFITTKVKAAILGDPSFSAARIEVTTNKGVVKLSGTVKSEQNISRATELAKSQKDVKSVQNELTVNITEPGK